jgi:hypothetical protein
MMPPPMADRIRSVCEIFTACLRWVRAVMSYLLYEN